jgi:hypothetical protein
LSYGHAAFLIQKPLWLASAWAEVESDILATTNGKESQAMSTKTADKTISTSPLSGGIFTDDIDAMKFYEKRDQSTRNLAEGDLIYHDERLTIVKDIDRRGMVTLSDGHKFDSKPSGQEFDAWKLKVTFWRPRAGY